MFTGDLRSALNDYELLHHASFRHRIHKRDLYSRDPDVREVEYDSFGRLSLFVAFCYPRDAMLARVIEIATCLSVRLSVRHAPVL